MVKQGVGFRTYWQPLLLILLVIFSLVAPAGAEPQFNDQKEIQIGVTDTPSSLSPYALNTLNALADQYSYLFFDPLVRWGEKRQIEFRLLSRIRTLKNGKTRFYLKKNIFFHSGNLMNSADVIWSFNEAMSNKYLQRKLQYKIKITYINQYVFDIETQLTHDQLLDYLTHLFVLDSAYYIKHKIDYNFVQSAISAPIDILPLSGTGPYRVAEFSPGLNLRVQASENYWRKKPTFKNINFLKIKSPDSRLYALLADDIDISQSISNKHIASVQQLGNKNIYQVGSTNALFLALNEEKNDLFKRQTARNAIHLAINQTGILKHILYGAGRVDNTYKLFSPAVLPPPYDATRAKYLLKKIDAPKKLTLLVMAGQSDDSSEILLALRNMLQKVDIKLQVTEAINIKQWNELQSSHDLMLATWNSGLIEESNVYQDIFTNSLISPYISILFSKQEKSLTMVEKMLFFEEYQLSDKIIPLFSRNKIWAADKRFDLNDVFSVNAIPYWHLLTTN